MSIEEYANLDAKQAIALQKQLAAQISLQPLTIEPRYIAGVDCSFLDQGKYCLGAVVLWDMHSRQVIEQHTSLCECHFPYIPGLLSFREIPSVMAAITKLNKEPDVLMCDGHGIAHPRGIGIASHLGLVSGLPSLGCAKKRLFGVYQEPGMQRGARQSLTDQHAVIGTVLRSKDNVQPLFVSVGHKIELAMAEEIVLACDGGYRLPEPTRLADKLAATAKADYVSNPN